jgi:hypothetical protein
MISIFAWFAACAAAAVLVFSGAAKQGASGPASRALSSLAPSLAPWATKAVRAIATIELLTGAGLLVPQTQRPAAVSLAALGVIFAGVGVAGLLTKAQLPCGCFGSASGHPFGARNILAGAAFVAAAALVGFGHSGALGKAAPTVTAMFTAVLCTWFYRDVIRDALPAFRRVVLSAKT